MYAILTNLAMVPSLLPYIHRATRTIMRCFHRTPPSATSFDDDFVETDFRIILTVQPLPTSDVHVNRVGPHITPYGS